MQKEFRKIERNLRITDEVTLFGMCTGNVRVEQGGIFHLQEMCTGNVEVTTGGTLQIEGMCTGNLLNSGGTIEVMGTVTGNIETRSGVTKVHPNAQVRSAPA